MFSPLFAAVLLPLLVTLNTLVQTLLLPGMSVAAPTPSSDGCLYIASSSDKGIRQLRPVPLERQAKLLAAAGDFQGALELLTLMEDEDVTAAAAAAAAGGGNEEGSEVPGKSNTAAAAAAAAAVKRQQLEDVLRLRFGYHLFEGAFCGSSVWFAAFSAAVAEYDVSKYASSSSSSLLWPGDALLSRFSTAAIATQRPIFKFHRLHEMYLVHCLLWVAEEHCITPNLSGVPAPAAAAGGAAAAGAAAVADLLLLLPLQLVSLTRPSRSSACAQSPTRCCCCGCTPAWYPKSSCRCCQAAHTGNLCPTCQQQQQQQQQRPPAAAAAAAAVQNGAVARQLMWQLQWVWLYRTC
jgi:hypothetical protein